MDALATKVAEFVARTDFDRLPEEVVRAAKSAFLDCLGVALAGANEESARICAALAREEGGVGEATIIGQAHKASTAMAALSNGTAAHALDYDHSFLMGQPTAGLIPAALAMGEALQAGGRQVLAAYVAGFEVVSRLARSMPQLSTHGHWHSTSSLGTLGAAGCCAKIAGLDASGVLHALGISASMASGLVWNFATMTKPLHAGLAAKNGVLAARLAARGFTSSPSTLEQGKGVFDCFARGLECDLSPFEGLGTTFDLAEIGISIKPYPCGGLTHTAVDAVLELRRKGLLAEQVETMNVGVTPHVFDRIMTALPQNGIEGKFSMPYILARALVDGELVLDTFTDESVRDPVIRRLAEKIAMNLDATLEETAEGGRPAHVTVKLTDGRVASRRLDFARGTPRRPMSTDEVRAKFEACASRVLTKEQVKETAGVIDTLDELEDIGKLCALLTG